MGEEDLKKGYETPFMPKQPIHEGYTPATMPFMPVGGTPSAQNQPPAPPTQKEE